MITRNIVFNVPKLRVVSNVHEERESQIKKFDATQLHHAHLIHTMSKYSTYTLGETMTL